MLTKLEEHNYLTRIHRALESGSSAAKEFVPGTFSVQDNGGRNVVTQVDRKISDVLRQILLRQGEGWLSEEDVDDQARLGRQIVWVVDPLDGTREFVDGIPEPDIQI